MDTATEYRVVFSGHVRNGFDRDAVRQTLAQQLKLAEAQSQQLFDGKGKHTLKRTDSEAEAKRYVLLLAKLGAIASVEQDVEEAAAAPGKKVKKKTKTAKPAQKKTTPVKYSPFPRNVLFKPALILAVAIESLFTVVYALLLLALFAGAFYYSLFTQWAAHLVGNALLGLAIQVLCFPLAIVLLLLAAKPLLSLLPRYHRGVLIPANQEPDLHMFVEDVCQRADLPLPLQIRLNNDVAVETRHHRGVMGFFRGERVLTIGVPLMAAMNTSQLAALIAQSMLCHRSRNYPRMSFLVMAANDWLQRALYQDDVIDRGLRHGLERGRFSPGMVNALEKLFTLSRRLMAPRIYLSRLFERRIIHRLIADADKMAFALAGSEGFSHMLDQQRLLGHGRDEMVQALQQQWEEKGELPDDMVQQLLLHVRSYPATINKQLQQVQEQKKADSGDIVPSDAQRIKSLSKQHRAPGYDCLSPANTLLRYFTKLTHTMTLRYYHNRMHIPITPDKLVRQIVKGSMEYELNQRIDDYFNRMAYLTLPLKLGLLLQGKTDEQLSRDEWQNSVKQCKTDYSRARVEYSACVEAEDALLAISMKEVMMGAELWRRIDEGKPRKGELEEFHQLCRDREDEYEEALLKLRQYLKPYANRLASALSILKFDTAHPDNEQLLREVNVLVGVYDRIETVLPQLRSLKLHTQLLQTLLSYRSGQKQPKLNDRIAEQAADIRQLLTSMRVALKDIANPYPAHRGGKQLMNYLLMDSYTVETPAGDVDRGNDVVLRLGLMQKRILGRLIDIALQVEEQLQ